jgi:hypothetical protein
LPQSWQLEPFAEAVIETEEVAQEKYRFLIL